MKKTLIILLILLSVPVVAKTIPEAINKAAGQFGVGGRARLASRKESDNILEYQRKEGAPLPMATYLVEGKIAGGKGRVAVYMFASEAQAKKMYRVCRSVTQSEITRMNNKQKKSDEYWYEFRFNEGKFEDTTCFLVRMLYAGMTLEEGKKLPESPGKNRALALLAEWDGKNLQSLTWSQGNIVVGMDSMVPTASRASIKPFGRKLYAELMTVGAGLTVEAHATEYQSTDVDIPLQPADPSSILITGKILDEYGKPIKDVQAFLRKPAGNAEIQPDGSYRIYLNLKDPDDEPLVAKKDIVMNRVVSLQLEVDHKAYKFRTPLFEQKNIEVSAQAGWVTVRGEVYDARAKRPVPNAEVKLSYLIINSAKAKTNRSGEYEVALKLPGKLDVSEEATLKILGEPMSAHLGFIIKSGKYKSKKLTVASQRYEPVKTLRVKGLVVGPKGAVVPRAHVTCQISGCGRNDVVAGNDGRFTVDVEVNKDGLWRQTVRAGKLVVGVPDPVDVLIKKIKNTDIGAAMDKKFLAAANELVGKRLENAPDGYKLMWKNAGAVIAIKADIDKMKEAIKSGDAKAIKKAMKFESFKKYDKVLKQGPLGEYANAFGVLSNELQSVGPIKAANDLEKKLDEMNKKFKEQTGVDVIKAAGFDQKKGQTIFQKSFHQMLLHVGATQYTMDNV